MLKHIPLFPLNTVLFPEGVLPLRIFESRYLDMVSECLRSDGCFGVCLITSGNEAGTPAECHDIGTFAHIVDWDQGEDGILGVTAKGGKRFRVVEKRLRPNKLLEGDVEIIDENDDEELPVEFQLLSDLLRQIVEKFELTHLSGEEKYLDASWVSCRLAELLPLELEEKQDLLETDDPVQRLAQIQSLLQVLNPEQ
ncbi:MAG TPA: LON peptidase substrate-binding domain-containing protein [Gammaproteobacteria bacterium]